MDIREWDTIKDEFSKAAIILGNGASIAFHNKFNYSSLYEIAGDSKIITDEIAKIFKLFSAKTKSFEYILQQLWYASNINKVLKIKGKEMDNAYYSIRTALIDTVQTAHGSFQDWKNEDPTFSIKLEKAANFLKNFSTVISLNYDCLVYWIIMKGKDLFGNWLKDTFTDNGQSTPDWDMLRTCHGKAEGATLVLYPHGNLSLVTDREQLTKKLTCKKTSFDLITFIKEKWETKEYAPLFISEGDSKQKLDRIRSNSYLARVYSELYQVGNKIVIYGWGVTEQDEHILKAILHNHAQIEKIGISIFNEDSSCLNLIYKYFPFLKEKIILFDANSINCWIY